MNVHTLLIDNNNLFWRCLGGGANPAKVDKEIDYNENSSYILLKNEYLQSLISLVKTTEPSTNIIVAIDDRNYWRKDFYPEYKQKRNSKGSKTFERVDFDKLYPAFDDFMNEMRTVFPQINFVRIAHLEADDIIAIAVRNTQGGTHCISTDRDLYQLYANGNYEQSRFGNDVVSVPHPKSYLYRKVCQGDRGDNITGIIPRLGDEKHHKTFDKLNESGELQKMIEEDDSITELYQRNRDLIDFDRIPKYIVDKITDELNAFTPKKMNGFEFYSFLVKHELSFIVKHYMDDFQTISTKMWDNQKSEQLLLG